MHKIKARRGDGATPYGNVFQAKDPPDLTIEKIKDEHHDNPRVKWDTPREPTIKGNTKENLEFFFSKLCLRVIASVATEEGMPDITDPLQEVKKFRKDGFKDGTIAYQNKADATRSGSVEFIYIR